MKISPLAVGTGVPQGLDNSTGRTSPDRIAAAKAIAQGLAPEAPQSSGDAQVDKIQKNRIKMRTNVSTDRQMEPVLEQNALESPTLDDNEPQTTEGSEETKPLSPQFAALMKQKRALQVEAAALAKAKSEFETSKTQTPAGSEDLKAQLKANPLSVLRDAGVTYDQLTEAILNDQAGSNPELQELKAYVKSLEEKVNNQFTTRDEQVEQQVLGDIRRDAQTLVESQAEQFEAIREAKATDQVVELIHRTFKTTGEMLDVATAAELVETQLIEEALPFARLKTVQKRLTPQEELAQTPAPQNPNNKIMRTLTNRDSARPVMDRRARAIAAMQGTLKRG